MNIMAPKFLQRQDPQVDGRQPNGSPRASPQTTAFLDSVEQQAQELAYFRSHNAQLENDVKLANERIRSLESELYEAKEDRDFLQRHSTTMLTSLHNILTIIVAAEKSAREHAFAPPGSGTQRPAENDERDQQIVEGLAAKLAPITQGNEQ